MRLAQGLLLTLRRGAHRLGGTTWQAPPPGPTRGLRPALEVTACVGGAGARQAMLRPGRGRPPDPLDELSSSPPLLTSHSSTSLSDSPYVTGSAGAGAACAPRAGLPRCGCGRSRSGDGDESGHPLAAPPSSSSPPLLSPSPSSAALRTDRCRGKMRGRSAPALGWYERPPRPASALRLSGGRVSGGSSTCAGTHGVSRVAWCAPALHWRASMGRPAALQELHWQGLRCAQSRTIHRAWHCLKLDTARHCWPLGD